MQTVPNIDNKGKSMKSKVLVVGMSDILGGVEHEVLSIISRCKGIRFDFLCYGDDYPYEKELPDSSFFYLPYRRKRYFESQRKLKIFLKENKDVYDCVWVNMSSASNSSVQRLAKKYTSAKVITHSHSSRIEHDNKILKKAHEILHLLNRRNLVKNTDVLLACSESAAKHLYGKESENAQIIYNGIETERFRFSSLNRISIRNELGIPDDTVVLVCVGRLVAVKNIEFAIRILSACQKTAGERQICLLLIGDGNERSNLEEYVKEKNIENVLFLGQKSNVKPYLDAVDVLLMPSLFEGFPVSAVEAQTNGLRCLLSNYITKEVCVTDLVSFLEIGETKITSWTEAVLSSKKVRNREGYASEVKEKGLDIVDISKTMEEIFSRKDV